MSVSIGKFFGLMKWIVLFELLLVMASCKFFMKPKEDADTVAVSVDSSYAFDSSRMNDSALEDQTLNEDTAVVSPGEIVNTKNVHPDELVNFAETLIGIPYHYGSTDPKAGFDCSGFITYVFHHFHISVPRSSIDFTNVGKEVPVTNARRGDLILFTGTDSTERFVGHMGIVVSNVADTLKFIHSTSGKVYGVTITPLNNYYKGRFVKTIRVFQ